MVKPRGHDVPESIRSRKPTVAGGPTVKPLSVVWAVCFSSLLATMPEVYGEAGLPAETVLAGLREYRDRISTIQCDVRRTMSFPSGRETVTSYDFRYKDGRLRWDLSDTSWAEYVKWDTAVLVEDDMRWLARPSELRPEAEQPTALIADATFAIYNHQRSWSPVDYLWSFNGRSWEEFASASTLDGATTGDISGTQCVVLSFKPKSSGADSNRRDMVWVAPSLGYAVLRYEAYERDGALWCRYDYEYQRLGEDLWFPSSFTRKSFAGHGTADERWEISSVVLNEPLSEELFRLDFPPGTQVTDFSANIDYTVGTPRGAELEAMEGGLDLLVADLKDGDQDALPPEVLAAAEQEVEAAVSGFDARPLRSPWWRLVLVVLMSASAAVVLYALARRFTHPK